MIIVSQAGNVVMTLILATLDITGLMALNIENQVRQRLDRGRAHWSEQSNMRSFPPASASTLSRTKEHGSNADVSCALFDRDLEVRTHSHRQVALESVERGVLLQPVA